MSRWIDACSLAELPALGARQLRIDAQTTIAIFRAADDAVFALLDRCPHKGGPLSQGIVHGRRVTCPLHGWFIELEHGSALAPDVGCVRRYAVRLEGDRVWVELDAEEQRETRATAAAVS